MYTEKYNISRSATKPAPRGACYTTYHELHEYYHTWSRSSIGPPKTPNKVGTDRAQSDGFSHLVFIVVFLVKGPLGVVPHGHVLAADETAESLAALEQALSSHRTVPATHRLVKPNAYPVASLP